jgi:hypothetical protein
LPCYFTSAPFTGFQYSIFNLKNFKVIAHFHFRILSKGPYLDLSWRLSYFGFSPLVCVASHFIWKEKKRKWYLSSVITFSIFFVLWAFIYLSNHYFFTSTSVNIQKGLEKETCKIMGCPFTELNDWPRIRQKSHKIISIRTVHNGSHL